MCSKRLEEYERVRAMRRKEEENVSVKLTESERAYL